MTGYTRPCFTLLSSLLGPLLLVVHAGLLAWALIGLIEWVLPSVAWQRVSNPLFPRWLLLGHWLAVLVGASVFLVGYLRRWPGTPRAVAAAYVPMAVVCAIETFGYLTHPGRFIAMAAEYTAYLAIPETRIGTTARIDTLTLLPEKFLKRRQSFSNFLFPFQEPTDIVLRIPANSLSERCRKERGSKAAS